MGWKILLAISIVWFLATILASFGSTDHLAYFETHSSPLAGFVAITIIAYVTRKKKLPKAERKEI